MTVATTYDVENDPRIWPRAVALARSMLMTGPRATPPRWRAIRKTALRIVRGRKPLEAGQKPWRSFPREEGQ